MKKFVLLVALFGSITASATEYISCTAGISDDGSISGKEQSIANTGSVYIAANETGGQLLATDDYVFEVKTFSMHKDNDSLMAEFKKKVTLSDGTSSLKVIARTISLKTEYLHMQSFTDTGLDLYLNCFPSKK